jgi:2-methylcitrate dehydratase PrpD
MRDVPETTRDRQALTSRFAAACAAWEAHTLPDAVRERTRLVILDTLGAMLSASRPVFPGTRRLEQFVRAQAPGPCPVVGTALGATLTDAALMNGYLAYALDVETHHGPAIVHAAAAVLPAAVGAAATHPTDGAAFVAAVALGVEVACRVALAIGPNDLYARGLHPTAIAGTFGAAAAAGRLLGLDADGIERALGLAATAAGGLLAWATDATEESRPLNPGLAARNGVTAARLAATGFGAPRGVLDPGGKYTVFGAWSLDGAGRPERLLDGFGDDFAVMDLIFKRHACCAFLHPAVDALLEIRAGAGLTADDLAAIEIRFPRSGAPMIDGNPLRSHRAQYILPLAAARGVVDFADVIVDRSDEPAIHRLAAATTFVHDDALDPLYPARYVTRLALTDRDGRTHERRVDWARGTPQNPMRDDEILAKFHRLAEDRVDPQVAGSIADLVLSLDRQPDLGRLFALLRVDGDAAGAESVG